MREEGEEISARHERSNPDRSGPKAAQAHGDRLRRPEEGVDEGAAQDGEEGRDVAVRAVRRGGPPVRAGGLRQEGAAGVREERRVGDGSSDHQPGKG